MKEYEKALCFLVILENLNLSRYIYSTRTPAQRGSSFRDRAWDASRRRYETIRSLFNRAYSDIRHELRDDIKSEESLLRSGSRSYR